MTMTDEIHTRALLASKKLGSPVRACVSLCTMVRYLRIWRIVIAACGEGSV